MKLKSIISILLVLTMLFSCVSLTACKKTDSTVTKEIPKEKRTAVYSTSELDSGEIEGYAQTVQSDGDNIYATFSSTYTVVRNNEGEEVERFSGYYYSVNGAYENDDDGFILYAEALSSSTPVDVTADASDESSEYSIEGEPDEFGVIIDEYNNIQVPEGWWIEYERVTSLDILPLSGAEKTHLELNMAELGLDENAYMNSLFADGKGNLIILASSYVWNEETMDGINKYYLVKMNPEDVSKTEVTDFSSLLIEKNIVSSDEYFYMNCFAIGGDGRFYFDLGNGADVYSCNETADDVKKIELDGSWIQSISVSNDGAVVSYYGNDYNQKVAIIANGTSKSADSDTLKNFFNTFYNVVGACGNKIYAYNGTGVSYYDFDTDSVTEDLNYINSDIDSSNISSITLVEEGKMLMSETKWDIGEGKTVFTLLTKVPDEEIEEEVIIKLAMVTDYYELRKTIINFNKRNNGLRISVVNYESYNNEENGWTGAVTQMNNDITSGTLPDIVLLNSQLPVESYFHKGVFVDLNTYIDSENGINRADYLDNIFKANETDGKLYSAIVSFNVATLVAKSKYVGTNQGWTFEEMVKTIKSMPDGMEAFYGQSRDSIIESVIGNAMSGLVDWNTGETEFGSQAFVEFINYLKTCREKSLWDEYYESIGDIWDEEAERELSEKEQLKFWNDTGLLDSDWVSTYSDITSTYNTFASKDITFVGYPGSCGNGSVISPSLEFAISSKSQAKNEAWEFIKFMFEEGSSSYNFSVNRKHNEDLYNEAIENSGEYGYSYSDEDIEWMREYGYSEDYINYIMNSNTKFDESMKDTVSSLIEGAEVILRTDDSILDIITEELSGFFGGTKSAEDTARVIASRVKILIAERS